MAGGEHPWSGRRLHLIGLGGAGMSGLAAVAAALGARVSGSDRADSEALGRLRDRGVAVAVGHDERNLPAGDDVEVVVSTAIPRDNPERAAGERRGLRELHRADLLGEVTALRPTIAVTGTHGKTTTSSMAAHALRAVEADPSFLLGGDLRSAGTNAHWGAGEWLVVEADESDRSLLKLHPRIAVVTNMELDHHATYGSTLELAATFREFLRLAPEAVVWDRPELTVLREAGAPLVAYDVPAPRPAPGRVAFDWRGHEVVVPVAGAHNALNAAAALEACALAGADVSALARALAEFAGAGRRFERVGATPSGVEVYDDYAHHPTEVEATLAAARTLGPARLVAVFQPHLYSRTRAFAAEFGRALAAADLVAVLDVYPARELAADPPGVDGSLVARAAATAGAGRPVLWLPTIADAARVIPRLLRAGDVLVTLGAGDVDALARTLVAGEPSGVAK